MTASADDTSPGPYARAAPLYWNAGWHGALPLPAHKKASPPDGWTGHKNPGMPSYGDILQWVEMHGDGNIGIRLPRNVVGIDVDNYGTKTGVANLSELTSKWGALPATWISSSRMETGSGIALYRVDEGLQWPGKVTDAIEVIQFGHRYMVAWPSLHPEGRTYRWHDPSGTVVLDAIPSVDELPRLPTAWVEGLTRGEMHEDQPRAGLDDPAAAEWLAAYGMGVPCKRMKQAIESSRADLLAPGATRHDTTVNAVMYVVRLIGEGHSGGFTALSQVHSAYAEIGVGVASRQADVGEWGRALKGAVDIVAARPMAHRDPCNEKFIDGGLRFTDPTSTWVDPMVGGEIAPKADDRPRSTWWPLDTRNLLDGTDPEPPPRYLTRLDGAALLYAGKVNGIIGESESGKSFIALLAVAQALLAGDNVTYIDFEDTGASTIARLRLLSVPDEQVLEKFRYIGPQEGLDHLGKGDLEEHLRTHQPALIVVDGFNAAMTLLGLDLNSNTDATKFSQDLLRPLTKLGACIVYIDHLPKNSKDVETKGGIGAQAKRAMTTGCTLKAEVITQFGRGTSGKVRLLVDKDRPGHVRGALEGAMAGMFIVTAGADGSMVLAIEKPPSGPWRPTAIMEEISTFLASCPDGASGNAIEKAVEGKADYVRKAVKFLLDDGYIKQHKKGQATISTFVRAYSNTLHLDDLVPRPDLVPTSSGRGGESPSLTSSLSTSIGGGTRSEVVTGAGEEDTDDEPPRPGVELNRGQLESQTAAYRDAMEAGRRPRYIEDGTIIDKDGAVVWAPR